MGTVPHAVDPQRAAEHGNVVMRLVDEIFPLVEGMYVDLHKNPELSHQEHRTASAVAGWLDRAGFEVHTGVGGTGVVGILRNGEGPTVLLRGDMDALPLEEKTGLPYASTARGVDENGNDVPVMHACGHDAHTACLVGAADLLADARQEWRGTLMVVAQPAEETIDGAATMLQDGLYTRFGRPDIALGQHIGPQPAGMISHRAGVILAASSTLRIRIFGDGGHASQPHTTVDPVVIAASIVTRLQSVVAREVSPSEMAVVTVGTLQAGTKANIIPDEAYLEVNTRALTDTVGQHLDSAIERIVRAEAAAAGAAREPEITRTQEAGVTCNDAEATEQVASAHRAYFGDGYVIDLPEPFTGSEDFGELGLPGDPDPVPYAFWFVGATPHDVWEEAPGETPYEKLASLPGNHSSYFAPERELTLRAGLAALTMGALTYLGRVETGTETAGQAAVPAMDHPQPAPEGPAPGPFTGVTAQPATGASQPITGAGPPVDGGPPPPPEGAPVDAPPPPEGAPMDVPPPPSPEGAPVEGSYPPPPGEGAVPVSQEPPADAVPPPPPGVPSGAPVDGGPPPPPEGAPVDAPPPPEGAPMDVPPPPSPEGAPVEGSYPPPPGEGAVPVSQEPPADAVPPPPPGVPSGAPVDGGPPPPPEGAPVDAPPPPEGAPMDVPPPPPYAAPYPSEEQQESGTRGEDEQPPHYPDPPYRL
ncbi:amidohydrolase [Haloactinospora alba]|uniref:amidohydrolase n=1 Tax=Haloactinospora alba TaxID=405555 RepID=UPI00147770BA|nr:amidohydrolase [Haloactinospora alba]